MRRTVSMLFLSALWGCTPIAQSSSNSDSNTKVLRNADMAYEAQVRTFTVHPSTSDPQALLLPAVTRLGQWNLMLEFDDLQPARDTYYAKIVHCNYDWSRSDLQDLDFMTEYNEFPINNAEYSVDTHIPYIHYWINLPPVKLPGNYLVVVYRGGDKSDIVLSKRFMVYDTRIHFENERNLVGAGSVAALNQQINFTINYNNIDIINPLESVKVVIRQNQRWDNMAVNIKPSFVREIEKQLEYRFFDGEKMFKGSNEFRFFDLRSLNQPGRNVAGVDKSVKPYEVWIGRDKSRAQEAYAQYNDLNGGYIIDNFDYRDRDFTNYANVNFTLDSREPLKGEVYVTGAFTNWNFTEENHMRYDSSSRQYKGRVLLKQGWYDYQFFIKSPTLPPYYLEGSHFETENLYEIFVYYKPFQPRADLLLGYIRLEKNQR